VNYHACMTSPHLWQQAAAFAARAHENQVRKDGLTPYFSHPVRVAFTVALVFGCTDEKVVAAALLHDVIEDTPTDYDDVLEQFGKEVADIVACLSKDMRLVEPQREREYDDQLRDGPWEAKLIKLADVYDNLSDATRKKSRRGLVEKARRALEIAGNEPRVAKAAALLERVVSDAAAV
jgi:(p)ppGpp synthase/HD superfamily hydrolase